MISQVSGNEQGYCKQPSVAGHPMKAAAHRTEQRIDAEKRGNHVSDGGSTHQAIQAAVRNIRAVSKATVCCINTILFVDYS